MSALDSKKKFNLRMEIITEQGADLNIFVGSLASLFKQVLVTLHNHRGPSIESINLRIGDSEYVNTITDVLNNRIFAKPVESNNLTPEMTAALNPDYQEYLKLFNPSYRATITMDEETQITAKALAIYPDAPRLKTRIQTK